MMLLMAWQNCAAYIFEVSGNLQVYNQNGAHYSVEAYSDDYTYYEVAITDANGNYQILFDVADGTNPVIRVSTYDYCSLNYLIESVTAFAGVAEVDLLLCSPLNTCYASFYVEHPQGDPYTLQFINSSWVENPVFFWDFGDGTTSTLENPVHTYDSPGYKLVSFTASNDSCSNSMVSWVLVGDLSACNCPTYFAPYCDTLSDGTPVTFTNQCEADCYGYPNATPCYDSSFCYNYFVSGPDSIQSNLISFHSLAFGEVVSYLWDFGDGTTSSDANPVHLFPAGDGGYLVQLTTTTASGCIATNYSTVFIGNGCDCPGNYAPVCFDNGQGLQVVLNNGCIAECLGIEDFNNCNGGSGNYCIADFGVTLIDASSFTYQFTDNSYGDGISYEWFFGDGGTSTEENPIHSYQNEGTYIVGLNITTADGCTAYHTYILMVGDGTFDCYASFGYEALFDDQLTLNFYDYSQSYTGSQIVSWSWSFGDGSTSLEQNPVHTYTEAGIYEISLSITTEDGCTSSTIYYVDVNLHPVLPACYAYYWLEQDPNDSMTIQFTDMSSFSVNQWYWSFGDGSNSTEQNPTHSYTEPGIYLTSLTVTDTISGCSNTYAMLVLTDTDLYYGGDCQALFIPQVNGLDVQFFDFSFPVPIATYLWDFGDGNTSDQSFPFHQYEQAGVYTVMLTITTVDGCSSSFSITMDLNQGNFWGNSAPSAIVMNTSDAPDKQPSLDNFRLFPNPARDFANLVFTSTQSGGEVHLSLHNATGQMVWSNDLPAMEGEQQLQVPTDKLPSGLYLLKLSDSNGQQTLKLMKE